MQQQRAVPTQRLLSAFGVFLYYYLAEYEYTIRPTIQTN